MAQLAIGLAGAAAGNFLIPAGIPALGLTGAGIGWSIGSALGGYALAPDLPDQQGPRLEDARVTSSAYGQAIPKVYSTASIAGNIIDASAVRERRKSSTVSAGGKDFGGPSQTTTTYSYDADLAVLLCEGEVAAILQIYANETLIYDATSGSEIVSPDWLSFKLYPGSETQQPDPTLEAIHSPDPVPAYRGWAYVVFQGYQFGQRGISVNFRFVVAKSATNTPTETDISLAGPVAGVGVSPRSQVVVAPINYASAQTAGEDVTALVGIDPFSRAIVWQTSITDGDAFYTRSWPVPCVHPDYVGLPFAEFTAIAVPEKGFPGTDGHLVLYDAITGALLTRYAVTDWSSGTAVAFPYPLLLSFVHHTSNVSAVVSLTWQNFNAVADSYSGTAISPPSGYVFGDPGIAMASNNDGLVLVHGETDPGGVLAMIIVDCSGTAITTTGVTLTNGGANYVGNVWDESNGCWWTLSNKASAGPVIYSVTPAGVATEYDLDALHGVDSTDCTVTVADGDPGLAIDALNGDLWWQCTNGTAYRWNPNSGAAPVAFSGGDNDGGIVYHRGTRTLWGVSGSTAHGFHTVGLTGNAESLQAVVEDLVDGTEIQTADLDASALAAISVDGFVVGRVMARRAALQMLRTVYLFDLVERSGVITAILRGRTPTVTLGDDDLGAHTPGSQPPPALTISQAAEASLPQQLDLTYLSAAQNYEPVTQSMRRQASAGGTTDTVTVSVVLSEADAAELCDLLLHLRHIGAERYEGRAMPSRIDDCAPAEVVNVSVDGEAYTWLIEESHLVEGGALALKGQRDALALYDSFAIGGNPRARSRTVLAPGVTLAWPLDLPKLRALDEDAGIYLGLGSYTPGWPGCEVYQATDGETFGYAFAHTDHAVFGVALNAADAPAGTAWDTASTLSVRAINSSFSSLAWASLVSGGNVAAWGAAGRWEVVAFTTASQQGDGSWQLSGLARGLRDTLRHADDHLAGDLFILLDEANLARLAWSADQFGVARQLKAATIGTFLNDAVAQAVTPGAQCLVPFAPCALHASKSGTTWTLTWQRQDRSLTVPFNQPPQSEATEAYKVQLLDSLGVVLATRDASDETFSYPVADQTTDYGDEIDIVYFRVAQVSAVTGTGPYSDTCAAGRIYPLQDKSGSGDVFSYLSDSNYNLAQPDDAFDDSSSTRWESGTNLSGGNCWVGCQWASGQDVRNVTVQQTEFGASNYGYATQMAVEYSDNGTTWTPAKYCTLSQDETVQGFDLPLSGSHTYWRIRATAWDVGGYRWSVKEAEFNVPNVL